MPEQTTEKDYVTSYVPRELIDRIDEYAADRDITRSRAMGRLANQALEDGSNWDAAIADATRALTDPSVTGFVLAVTGEDGETAAFARTREPGYPVEDDDVVDGVLGNLDRRSAAQYLAHITALEMLADQNEMSVAQTARDLGGIAQPLQARGARFTQLDEEGGPE